MVNQYKLTYFDVTGYGELIRYILHYGGKSFEDRRIEFGDEWNTLKPKTPMQQLPVLEIDGKTEISQSRAIARYLAKQCGIAGKDDIEQALADMYVDGVYDQFQKDSAKQHAAEFKKKFFENCDNDAKYQETYEKWKQDSLIPYMDILEKAIAKTGSGHLVGSKLTWADLVVGEMFGRFERQYKDTKLFENRPNMGKLVKMVHQLPGIAEYIQKPRTNPY